MELNDQQKEAVYSNESRILCLAGAGAGKTATLVRRVHRLVEEGADPSSILVLTFTNAAGAEMKERYKKLATGGMCPEFRTFHSFCYHLITSDVLVRNAVGYVDVPSVVDENEYKLICNKAKSQCGIKLSDRKLNGSVEIRKEDNFQLELYTKAVRMLLKSRNLITFDNLCYDVCELFASNDSTIKKYKARYKYIFVDEFQDTDPKQFKFVASFDHAFVFFVADVLQSIYGFRGADSSIVKMLVNQPGWHVIKMYENYRSTTNICEFANKMSHYADPSYRLELHGQRDGHDVNVYYGSHADNFENIVDSHHLNKLISMVRNADKEFAVLCRTNKEVQFISSRFKKEGITHTTEKPNRDNINILRSSVDNDFMLNWLSSFLDSPNYADYIRRLALTDNPDLEWFLNNYSNRNRKIALYADHIILIRRILRSTDDRLVKATKIFNYLGIAYTELNVPETVKTAKDFIEFVIEFIDKGMETNVYVGTIHSSKGLEYDTVCVMGVNDRWFQLKDEESKNLYYVGITRAKNSLHVFEA